MEDSKNKPVNEALVAEIKDANGCMAIGVGVGVAGTAASVLLGATCPLCFIVAPGLVGIGAFKRWKCNRGTTKGESDGEL